MVRNSKVIFPDYNYLVIVTSATGLVSTLGAFQAVTGLTARSRNGAAGTAVTLKRGVVDSSVLGPWINQMRASASLAGRNVLLTLRGESGQPTMSWQLANATPTSFNGPTLGAGGAPKAVAIEELVLAAENIQIVAPHTFGTVSRFNPVIRP
jgi:hypothetical protein